MLTQDELKKILEYNPVTGVFTRVKTGDEAGCINGSGYRQIRINGKAYLAHRLAWLYVYGKWPNNMIDHINRNKLDNRIENLRDVPQSVNGRNSKRSDMPDHGVYPSGNGFLVRFGVEGKMEYFGYFNDKDEARKHAKAIKLLLKLWMIPEKEDE